MECKFCIAPIIAEKEKELIDTLWNVNPQAVQTKEKYLRINRYIMECKYHGWKIF